MSPNSTPRRRFGVALGVVLSTVAVGLIGFAGTAGAHTNRSHAECKGDTTTLTVDLTAYKPKKANTVKITDGSTVLFDGEFRDTYQKEFTAPGDVEHTFTIAVTAWDDPDGKQRPPWSFTETYPVAACVTTPPETATLTETAPPEETTETTTTTTESSEVPTSSSVEAPPVVTTTPTTTTTTTTPPAVEEEALAETGASIALPLGIAGVLIVGGAVALFVVRRRSKA